MSRLYPLAKCLGSSMSHNPPLASSWHLRHLCLHPLRLSSFSFLSLSSSLLPSLCGFSIHSFSCCCFQAVYIFLYATLPNILLFPSHQWHLLSPATLPLIILPINFHCMCILIPPPASAAVIPHLHPKVKGYRGPHRVKSTSGGGELPSSVLD